MSETEMTPPPSVVSENTQGVKEGTEQFIADLFPQIFSELMQITSLREQILTTSRVFDRRANMLQLRFDVPVGNDTYQLAYAVIGKKDKTFGITKNPRHTNGKFIFDSLFTMTYSENGYYNDPLTHSGKSLSNASPDNHNRVTVNSNNLTACESALEVIPLLKSFRDQPAFFVDDDE